jgi:hypothetical protein
MGNGNGVSRGDRNRNARLQRLRALVPARLGDPSRWRAPSGGLFDEAMFVPTGGLPVTGSSIAAADPVVSTSSDHATITVHLTAW